MTCRAVFIVGPDHKLKLSILYPASCGRNFSEIIRVRLSNKLFAQINQAVIRLWKLATSQLKLGAQRKVVNSPGDRSEHLPFRCRTQHAAAPPLLPAYITSCYHPSRQHLPIYHSW